MARLTPRTGSLHCFRDPNELAEGTATALADLVTTVTDTGRPFRIALSGGSTPQRLYRLLAKMDLPWNSMRWFWGDERNVPPDHAESNYRMVREALLDRAGVPPETVFPVPIQVDDPAQAARDYDGLLRSEFAEDGEVAFDLVLLGMGDDAHTASLFPSTSALAVTDRYFVENWVPKFDAYRLTLTAAAINAASNVWFLITGENKRKALAAVWRETGDAETAPSRLVHPEEGVLWWMVSTDALPLEQDGDLGGDQ